MNWLALNQLSQVEEIIVESKLSPIIIFKHSTRCSISQMSLSRFERKWNNETIKCYFLDILSFRSISNFLAEKLEIIHESPQVLVIKNGNCVYHDSHNGIDALALQEVVEQFQ